MTLIQNKPISIKIWIPETWRLPATYQEVEYIEFYWSQVISTDVNSLIAPFKVEVTYKKENTDTSDQTLVWQRQIWKFVNIYQNKYENLWSNSWDWTARADSFMHTIITDSTSWLYKDWTLLVSWTSWDKSSSYPLLIWAFSEDSYSSAKWFFKWKIYNVQITNNNILYRNYIPCYRKSDNAIWLYDLVSWNFITNVWSWTLGKWWNIQYNDKNFKAVYIWDKQVRPEIIKYIDLLIVWWGWWWWGAKGWWWWAWWLLEYSNYKITSRIFEVKIWAWWTWWDDNNSANNWWNSSFGLITAYWWWAWWQGSWNWSNWWSWGWGWYEWSWWTWIIWQWNDGAIWASSWAWWWWWAWWTWYVAEQNSKWWEWIQSSISWTSTRYAAWWGWCNQWTSQTWWNWWWWSWSYTESWGYKEPTNPTTYWSWWGWASDWFTWTTWYQWIVIVRYKTWDISATWWTITTSWEYTIHTFTEDWYFSF